MTIEKIIAQLDRISKDTTYEVIGNHIDLTFNDFEDFVDEKTVNEVLEWLEKNANYVKNKCYYFYHFDDIVVEVGYTSYDI